MSLRLALLGLDSDVLALARAAQASGRYEIALVCEAPQVEVERLAASARREPHWESLLLDKHVEAVIVSRGADRELRADQLRKLVQAKVPLLVVMPAVESIVGFEIDMIGRDAGGALAPYIPGVHHPAIAELAELAKADTKSPLGKIEQLVFERTLAERERDSILAQLARDAGLARAIVGNLTKVSAMGVAAGEASLANLSVHLSGPRGVLVRWSVGPVEGAPVGKLTLVGATGTARLEMPADERAWRLEITAHERATRTWPEIDAPAAALDSFAAALTGKEPVPAWLEACRDTEIAETAERSAVRGRTIELHQEEHSEEGTFKGVMSVGGCLALGLALAGLLVAFVVGGIQMLLRDPDVKIEREPWPLWLRLWPVYPLAFFLLLQLLQLVFRSGRTSSAKSVERPS